jgi:hypothetical protein
MKMRGRFNFSNSFKNTHLFQAIIFISVYFSLESGSCYIGQAGLKLVILPPQPPE